MGLLGSGKPEQKQGKRTVFSQPSLSKQAAAARPGDGTGIAAHRVLRQMQRDRQSGSDE